ncbi:MAG: hypothetical protein Q8Q14_00640 [Gemmatimonadales bacterium]|nr:hypothetical protein [Gemmatimonadales bacterium]
MPTVWKLVDDMPRAVECETPGYPNRDADGETMNSNTYFATEADAWIYAVRDAEAHVFLAARDVKNLRSALVRAEREASDAAIHIAKVLEAHHKWKEAEGVA